MLQDSSDDRSEGIEWEEFDVESRNGPDSRKTSTDVKSTSNGISPVRKDSKETKNALK